MWVVWVAMVAIVVRGCDSEAGMLDMEPPFEKHLFVDCVFVIQVFPYGCLTNARS